MNVKSTNIKELLEAGVHFGHTKSRWNPKMKTYIYILKNKVYIIDLQKTNQQINAASEAIKNVIRERKKVLFVGTKKQAQDIVKEEAERCGMLYVVNRWLGGTLTNYKTIKSRINRLLEMEEMEKNGEVERLTKKELAKFNKEKDRLIKNLGGLREMDRIPGIMFTIDSRKEKTAIAEAKKIGIPVVALVDTNCDPDSIDYPIVGNDDALKSIKLITTKIAEAIIEEQNALPVVEEKDIQVKDNKETPETQNDQPENSAKEEKEKEIEETSETSTQDREKDKEKEEEKNSSATKPEIDESENKNDESEEEKED